MARRWEKLESVNKSLINHTIENSIKKKELFILKLCVNFKLHVIDSRLKNLLKYLLANIILNLQTDEQPISFKLKH